VHQPRQSASLLRPHPMPPGAIARRTFEPSTILPITIGAVEVRLAWRTGVKKHVRIIFMNASGDHATVLGRKSRHRRTFRRVVTDVVHCIRHIASRFSSAFQHRTVALRIETLHRGARGGHGGLKFSASSVSSAVESQIGCIVAALVVKTSAAMSHRLFIRRSLPRIPSRWTNRRVRVSVQFLHLALQTGSAIAKTTVRSARSSALIRTGPSRSGLVSVALPTSRSELARLRLMPRQVGKLQERTQESNSHFERTRLLE
jgi:hypothetical protein